MAATCLESSFPEFPPGQERAGRLGRGFRQLGRPFPATRTVPSALEVLTQGSDSHPQTPEMRPQGLEASPHASEPCPQASDGRLQAPEPRAGDLQSPLGPQIC